MKGELKQFNIENVSINSGAYPTKMNNGAKTVITADKQDITDAYGQRAQQEMQAFGTAIEEQMVRNNPQHMADAILKIMQMKDGTRPLRYPLDAIAEGTDHEFINGTKLLISAWAKKYSVTIHD